VFHPATVIPSLVLVETCKDPARDADRAWRIAAFRRPYEARRSDGASLWQMFRYITLPGSRRSLFIAAMTA